VLAIHPVFQFLAILLVLYVLLLGLARFRSLHLKQKTTFKWKRHVTLGTTAYLVLLFGLSAGLSLVYFYWQKFLLTGLHGKIGLIMAPIILFGLITGHYMNRVKRKRAWLPLLHGLSNLTALILALIQVVTGMMVYNAYVLGN